MRPQSHTSLSRASGEIVVSSTRILRATPRRRTCDRNAAVPPHATSIAPVFAQHCDGFTWRLLLVRRRLGTTTRRDQHGVEMQYAHAALHLWKSGWRNAPSPLRSKRPNNSAVFRCHPHSTPTRSSAQSQHGDETLRRVWDGLATHGSSGCDMNQRTSTVGTVPAVRAGAPKPPRGRDPQTARRRPRHSIAATDRRLEATQPTALSHGIPRPQPQTAEGGAIAARQRGTGGASRRAAESSNSKAAGTHARATAAESTPVLPRRWPGQRGAAQREPLRATAAAPAAASTRASSRGSLPPRRCARSPPSPNGSSADDGGTPTRCPAPAPSANQQHEREQRQQQQLGNQWTRTKWSPQKQV